MKAGITHYFILLMIFGLAGCAAPSRYNDVVSAKTLSQGEQVTVNVSASIDAWRDSGVQVNKGQQFQLTAAGKWRTWGLCNYTGPDGIGLYTLLCTKSPLFPALVEGYSHSALIGKIGLNGTPFVVGADYHLTADTDGPLLVRINDAVNATQDNEGFVTLTVRAERQPNSDKSQNKQTSAAVADSYEAGQLPLALVKSQLSSRTALVIGNSDYAFSPLKNPVNDARAMAGALEKLGFEVTLRLNADQQQMDKALDGFGRKLLNGQHVALFYYAGHGVQVDGENYLIPTDAQIKRQSDVRYKAVNVGQVLGMMGESKDNLNIVILDACRDNPLPRSFRSARRGLARVESPKGTIIGFATSPGSTAADGDGDNGIYTKHILNNIKIPGASIEQVFKKVLQGVNAETNGQQVPWTESSFTGNFSFVP